MRFYSKKEIRNLYNKIIWGEELEEPFDSMKEILSNICCNTTWSPEFIEILDLLLIIYGVNNKIGLKPEEPRILFIQRNLFLASKQDNFKLDNDFNILIDEAKRGYSWFPDDQKTFGYTHQCIYNLGTDYTKLSKNNKDVLDNYIIYLDLEVGLLTMLDWYAQNNFSNQRLDLIKKYNPQIYYLFNNNRDTIKQFGNHTSLFNSICTLFLLDIEYYMYNYEIPTIVLKNILESNERSYYDPWLPPSVLIERLLVKMKSVMKEMFNASIDLNKNNRDKAIDQKSKTLYLK